MLAVIVWDCICGNRVKAMYETDGKTVVRCPKPSCEAKHIVDGHITDLWVQKENVWQHHEILPLIMPNR
jgi:hypothetical protein